MTNIKPVWLLDFDGVVNANPPGSRPSHPGKPDTSAWPRTEWISTTAPANGVDWPIWAARPVLDFIRAAHQAGVDIRWHTSWQEDIHTAAAILDLPELPLLPAPEYAMHSYYRGAKDHEWWKLPAARLLLAEEQRPLLWTDDDFTFELSGAACQEFCGLGNVTLIAPHDHTGLCKRHLRQIATVLDIQVPELTRQPART